MTVVLLSSRPACGSPFTREPVADTRFVHQVDGPLLEDARAHALDDIVLAAVLENHRVDAGAMQQMPEHQPRRARANDSNLRPMCRHRENGE